MNKVDLRRILKKVEKPALKKEEPKKTVQKKKKSIRNVHKKKVK